MPRGITEKTKKRKELIYHWAELHNPVTVRQLFYRLSTLDAVPKSEAGYRSVGGICAQMRRDGELPFEWIADNTRWQRKPKTFNSMQDALALTASTYRRNIWERQNGLVEIWLEKEALAGVITPVTFEWDVALMVVKGYPSLSFTYAAARQMASATEMGKTNHIFYFGDHDPSGMDIFRHIAETLPEYAPEADINIQHVAVTAEQIQEMNLPSRPTKKTDTRAKGFTGESVELDAIPPDALRGLVSDCILSCVDADEFERLSVVEEAEKESIMSIVNDFSKNDLLQLYPPTEKSNGSNGGNPSVNGKLLVNGKKQISRSEMVDALTSSGFPPERIATILKIIENPEYFLRQ